MKEYQSSHSLGRSVALFLFACISVAGTLSCDSDRLNSNRGLGSLSLSLSADTANVKGGTVATKGEFLLESFENVDNYLVQVFQESDTIKSALYKNFPDNLEIEEGSYTLRASKGSNLPAAFDNPYFEGSTDFMIKKDMKTPLQVTCRMANARVKVYYTNAFEQAYTDYSVSVRTNLMDEVFTIEKGETRPLYLQVDPDGSPLKIAITLMRASWKEEKVYEVTNPSITLNPRESVTLSFDTDGKTGDGLSLSIGLDESMVEADWNEGIPDFMWKPFDVLGIWACGFENNAVTEMNVTDGYPNDSCTVKAEIPGRIKECWVVRMLEGEKVDSVDMATAEGYEKATKEWGITSRVNPIFNKKGIELDLKTAFNKMVATGKEETHGFSVYINDALNVMHTTEMVTANVKLAAAAKPTVSLFELSVLPKLAMKKDTFVHVMAEAGVKSLKLIVKKDNTPISTYDDLSKGKVSGIYYDAVKRKVVFEKSFTTQLTSLGTTPSVYTYELVVTDNIENEGSATSKFTVALPEYTIIVPEGDIWATKATFKMKEEIPYSYKYQVLKGDQWTDVETSVKGLTPGTEYKVRAIIGDDGWSTKEVGFMTESALQVPNAGMEKWHNNGDAATNTIGGIGGKTQYPYRYWEIWYPWLENENAAWNTINLKTTQDGETYNGRVTGLSFPFVWTRYVANSGTIRTSEKKSGNYAALIRTVGWGTGSSAPGGVGIIFDGVIKRFDPGYLYLGSYTEAPESSWSGLSFDSRPSSVSFYCKYIRAKGKSQSTDKYLAKVIVEHRDGDNIIKLGEGSLSEGGDNDISSYAYKKIQISYTNTTLKATHLYIMFKSGTVAEYQYFSVPSNNNLSNGEYVGSQLYIDDIELIYE